MKPKPVISYDDFAKLDIRAGLVVAASAPEWSSKLLRFEVDFGEEIGKRIIFSGIRKWYAPEVFVGKKFMFVVNIEVKRIGDEQSQGMMIMADTINGNLDDKEKPILIALPDEVEPGTVVR